MGRRRQSGADDILGPGTDLAITLFAVMACGFALLSGIRVDLASALAEKGIQLTKAEGLLGETEGNHQQTLKDLLAVEATLAHTDADRVALAAARVQIDGLTTERESLNITVAKLETELAEAREGRRKALDRVQELDENAQNLPSHDQLAVAQAALAEARLEVAKIAGQLLSTKGLVVEKEKERVALQAKLDSWRGSVLQPYDDALLEVRVSGNMPLGADLDLYLQTPSNQLIYWMRGRVIAEDGQETTRIVPSEDYRFVTEGGPAMESIYSIRPEWSAGKTEPYLVGCMVRLKNGSTRALANTTVDWSVRVRERAADGWVPATRSARLPFSGVVLVEKEERDQHDDVPRVVFSNLSIIGGFYLRRGRAPRIEIVDASVIKGLRGFSAVSSRDGASVIKIREGQ